VNPQRDYLGWAALVAALVGTASADYSLARAIGFGTVLAGCIPAALDIYALRAFRVHRDVAAVVVALIAVNAAAHLVASGQLPVSVPLIVAVSAIAPLVLWRVHVLSKPVNAPEKPRSAPKAAPEPLAPVMAAEKHTAIPSAPDADPLLPDAWTLDAEIRTRTGKPASLRQMQSYFKIGQARAQRIRAALAT
jgi:hypothetical protein